MAKKKENTPAEKKLIKTVIWVILFLVPMTVCSVLIWFNFVASPDVSYSKKQEKILERTKWNQIIPGSTWKYSDTTADKSILPNVLKNCESITFSADGKSVFFNTSESVFEGQFEFETENSGIITLMKLKLPVKFSDVHELSYMLRLTYQDWGSLEFFIQ